MPTPVTFCAIYVRLSLDATGKRLGVKRQLMACRAIAKAKGWTVVEEYEDNSISAFKKDVVRPRYNQMEKDFRAGKFTRIIVWDLDRLTRQPRQIEDWIDAVEGMDFEIATATGDIDLNNREHRKQARNKAADAAAEMDRKSARQKLAVAQRLKRGKVPAGVRLTGYTKKGKIKPDEAEVIKRIFAEFTEGKALRHIANGLNADAIDTRSGRPWHPSSVRTMLLNPRYAGRQVHNGAATGKLGKWKPIVDNEIFDQAQGILRDPSRKKNRTGTARKYLGSGLYECGICRVKVTTNGQRYSCPRCGRIRTMAPIDKLVLDSITARLSQPDVADLLATPADEFESQRLDEEIQSARARIENVDRDYDDELIDGQRYQIAMAKAQGRLQDALAARAALAGDKTLAGLIASPAPAQMFLDADLDTKRVIIAALMFVLIMPGRQGQRGFDEKDLVRAWRRTRITDDENAPVVPDIVREVLA